MYLTWARSKVKCAIIPIFYGAVLYLLNFRKIQHTWANIARLGKYSTLGKSLFPSLFGLSCMLLHSEQIVSLAWTGSFEWTANARLRTFRVTCHSMAPRSTFAISLNKPASTINQLNHCRECNMEKIALGLGLETNIVLSFASCYISLSTALLYYFFHIALAAVLARQQEMLIATADLTQ